MISWLATDIDGSDSHHERENSKHATNSRWKHSHILSSDNMEAQLIQLW